MNKIDNSKYNNSWYNAGRSKWVRILWYFTNIIFFKSGWNISSGVKLRILKIFGANIGVGINIKPCVNIKYPWNLAINDYAWIGENVWIDNLVMVDIGANACISQGSMLLCGNHNYKSPTFDLMVGEIHIEEGAWVGAQSVVCPGVTMKSHSVLSVGSVASSDLDAYGIYRGNPAIKIKERVIEKS